MKIIISGAGGFVGQSLVQHFQGEGAEVVRLVRHATIHGPDESTWDPANGELDPSILAGADAVINLNGRNISQGRWTPKNKKELRSSRLDATRTIVRAIRDNDRPPAVLINASATGVYGDRGDQWLDEDSAAGNGFLAELAEDWESAATEARSDATRVVLLRLGMVLGDGGALAKMLTPFKLGLGGPIGNGRQFWPWIAMDDVVGAIAHATTTADLDGPVNLVAPETVTSQDFALALGRHLGRPAVIPTPAFVVKAALGEMAEALLLASTRVQPSVLEATDYRFDTPTLAEAFQKILG